MLTYFIKEMLKISFKICYIAGHIVGFNKGYWGIFQTPTEEEIQANNIMQRHNEKVLKELLKEAK